MLRSFRAPREGVSGSTNTTGECLPTRSDELNWICASLVVTNLAQRAARSDQTTEMHTPTHRHLDCLRHPPDVASPTHPRSHRDHPVSAARGPWTRLTPAGRVDGSRAHDRQ